MTDELLEPLTDAAREAVRLERLRPDPSPCHADAVLGRVTQTLGLGATAAGAVSAATTGAAKTGGLVSKFLVGGACLVLGAAGGAGGVYRQMSRSNAELADRVTELEAQRALSAADPVPNPPAREPEAVPVKPARTNRPAAVEADALREENVLLERSRTALLRREPQAALDALEELRRTHPRGRLSEERDALWVQALAQLGRSDEATEATKEFRRKYPRSVFLPSVDAAVHERP
jgi:hypothetical protein